MAEAPIPYLALLRGINVGGHRKIKMDALRERFTAWACADVRTYIQSGNVLFTATEDEEPLRQRLEHGIEEAFGFPVPVVLRTAPEVNQMLASSPYPPDALAPDEQLFAALLSRVPAPGTAERLTSPTIAPDTCQLVGRDVYLIYRQPYNQSKMTNAWLERTLGVAATTRNWRTLTTLQTMLAETTGQA